MVAQIVRVFCVIHSRVLKRPNVLEETRKIDECDMEKFGTPDRREKTIAMLGDRSWPNTAKQEGDKKSKTVFI